MRTNKFCIGIESIDPLYGSYNTSVRPQILKLQQQMALESQDAINLVIGYSKLTTLLTNTRDQRTVNKNYNSYLNICNNLGIESKHTALESIGTPSLEGFIDNVKGVITKIIGGIKNAMFNLTARGKEIKAIVEKYNEEYRKRMSVIIRHADILKKDTQSNIDSKEVLSGLGLIGNVKTLGQSLTNAIKGYTDYNDFLISTWSEIDDIYDEGIKSKNGLKLLITSTEDVIKLATTKVFTKTSHSFGKPSSDSGVATYYYENLIGGACVGYQVNKNFKVSNATPELFKSIKVFDATKDDLTFNESIPLAKYSDLESVKKALLDLNKIKDDGNKWIKEFIDIESDILYDLLSGAEEYNISKESVTNIVLGLLGIYLRTINNGSLLVYGFMDKVISSALTYLELSIEAKK